MPSTGWPVAPICGIILGEAIQRPPREVPLIFSEYGKPRARTALQSLHFNLSHCSRSRGHRPEPSTARSASTLRRPPALRICWSANPRSATRRKSRISLPDEKAERARQLLRIWTAKEAVLKALGTGLSHPPETVRILFGNPVGTAISDRPLAGVENQSLHELLHARLDGYQAFVSAPTSVTRIQMI